MIGMLLGELLAGMGRVVCAVETTEADTVIAAARCRPDLLIVDVRLDQGRGFRAVDAILRAGGSVPRCSSWIPARCCQAGRSGDAK